MRIQQILETTTAGSVASVAKPMMTKTREDTNVRGLKPVQQVMKGNAKKKGPYANSIVESKVTEDDLAEQDLIVIPGQGRLRRTGFVKHDMDQGEHEGHTLKNSLHTIARAASELDKRLSVQSEFPEWVSEKIGAAKGMMVSVMDYLISSQEMQHDSDAINEGDVSTSNLRTMYDLARMTKNYCSPEGQESITELLKILKWYMDQAEQGIAEDKKWDPLTGGDFPTDYNADDVATASGANNGEQWQAMLNYYTNDAFVKRALSDLYRQTQGTDFYGSALTADRYLATIELNSFGTKIQRLEKKYFPTKQDAYKYAQGRLATVLSIEKIDNTEDESDLITLPVMLGIGAHKKKWMLKFPSETFAQKWEFKHKNVASIQWPGGHDLEQKVDEGMGGGVDAKGRTQKQWLQLVKSKYPNANIMQAKMIDGPIQVTLPDGKKLHWEKVEQGVTEAFDLKDLRKAAASSRSPEDKAALKRNPNFGKIMQKSVDKHNKAVVKTKKDIGSRVADIGAGGKEYNVKTDAAWDAAKKKVSEGSKR
jgi:hypothetical protein